VLRPLTFDDAETVFLWHRSPDVTKYTGGLQNREQSFVSLARWVHRFQTQGWGPLAVQEHGTLQLIGWCGLQPLPATRDFELFYGYATEVWGHGYATEAGRALLRVGFVALPVDRIVARVHRAMTAPRSCHGIRAWSCPDRCGLPHGGRDTVLCGYSLSLCVTVGVPPWRTPR
jgi:RimJ/RimL family protein N-acetyltransferase